MSHTKKTVSILVLLIATFGCSEKSPFPEPKDDPLVGKGFTLVFSGDVEGQVAPCGCQEEPLGGLVAVENFLNQVKGERLFVDAGNLFFESKPIPEIMKGDWMNQAEAISETYPKLGVVASVPGHLDFAAGVESFQKLTGQMGDVHLASNSNLGLAPRKIVNLNGFKVGMTAVMNPADEFPEAVSVTQAVKPVWDHIQEMNKEKVEIFIVISQLGIEEDRKALEKISNLKKKKGIKQALIWVGGRSKSFLQTPEVIGKSLLVHAKSQNHYIGSVQLVYSGRGSWKANNYKLLPLGEKYAEPASGSKALSILKSRKLSWKP